MKTPNARGEPRPMAGATQERKLLGVGSTALIMYEVPSPAYLLVCYSRTWSRGEKAPHSMRLLSFYTVIVVNGSRVLPFTRAWHSLANATRSAMPLNRPV